MMAFADGWGWASWLAMALILAMFVFVVGGAGYMLWRSESPGEDPSAEEGPAAPPAP